MRFICLICFFIFTLNGIAQNNFKFDESNYKSIVEKSKTENKPIFLMLYASWCPHCAIMKKEILSDSLVSNFLSKNYICTWQDIEKSEGIMLKNKFKTTSLPTFLFLDSNEKELYCLKGELKSADFIVEIQNALNPKRQLPYLKKMFLLDPSNSEKCLDYLNALKKGNDRTALSEPAHQYLATQTESQLINTTNWRIISNGITDISSREFQYVLQHQKEFAAITSPLRVEKKITNIVSELLEPFTESLDTLNYFKQRKIAKTIPIQKIDSLVFFYDFTIAERSENWSSYRKVTIESTEKYVWNNAKILKEISQNYLKQISDISSLKEAIKWTNRSLELNDSYDGSMLLSRLYLKIKDKNSAIKFAKKAKIICLDMGWDPKDSNQLYLELGIK